jgi:hypothetical protein
VEDEITDAMLAGLRERFAAGPLVRGEDQVRRFADPPVTLETRRWQLQMADAGRVITCDGSAEGSFGGAATVAGDGRLIAGWFEADRLVSSAYAEWQAARLGLRLAGAAGPWTLVTDSLEVARQLGRMRRGKAVHVTAWGRDDPAADGEVRSLLRPEIAVQLRDIGKGGQKAVTALTRLHRVVHAVAWSVRRLVADGRDPAGDFDFVVHMADLAPRRQSNLDLYYQRRFAVVEG